MNFKAWADQLMSQGRFDHAETNDGENLEGATGMSPTLLANSRRRSCTGNSIVVQ